MSGSYIREGERGKKGGKMEGEERDGSRSVEVDRYLYTI